MITLFYMRFDVFRVDGIIINIYFLFVKAIDSAKKKELSE